MDVVLEESLQCLQTTGVCNDLEQATQMAQAMVTEYGSAKTWSSSIGR